MAPIASCSASFSLVLRDAATMAHSISAAIGRSDATVAGGDGLNAESPEKPPRRV